jgi:hypothetical protein
MVARASDSVELTADHVVLRGAPQDAHPTLFCLAATLSKPPPPTTSICICLFFVRFLKRGFDNPRSTSMAHESTEGDTAPIVAAMEGDTAPVVAIDQEVQSR